MSARFEPAESEVAAPFWEATKKRELALLWCRSCGRVIHYPRERCPACGSEKSEWRGASGKGEVYAFSVMHRPGNPAMADRVPYVVALVDLEEGARMMSNIVGCEPGAVRVGMPVTITWEELSDGRNLPLFEPSP